MNSEHQHINSLFTKQIHPFKQGLVCILLLILCFMVISLIPEVNPKSYWEAPLIILLTFALFNSTFSLSYKNKLVYFRDSVFTYLFLVGIGIVGAQWLSDFSLNEVKSTKMLFGMISFCYLLLLSILNAMRVIMEMVKRQDARLRGEDV